MTQQRFTKEEIIEKINDSFDSVENFRSEGLERVKLFHAVKNKALEKEKKRLSAKLGADHPRVKRVAARLQYNQGLFKDLDVEIERAKITVPSVDKDSWMVHGRVLEKDKTGVPGLTVGIYDENGNWIRELGYGCTDKRGYFFIIYTLKEKAEPEVPETMKLFLYVSDKNHRILYRDSEPLFVKIGQIDYREIHLTDEEICPPPEPGEDVTPVEPDTWIVKGRVADEEGRGIGGLTVSLYDKDLIFDDRLGTTLTDEAGNFMAGYKTEEFLDLFEACPDIYLKVSDQEGNELYSSRKMVRCEAGRIESFNIKIKRTTRR
jgi:hypothetical protein